MRALASLPHRPLCARLFCATLAALALACGSSAAPSARSAGDSAAEVEWKPPAASKRELSERIAKDNIEEQLAPYIESIGAGFGPGYQASGFVSVAGAGQVLYAEGFGFADASEKTRNTADTPFRIGAVTKQFTAAAILRLCARGKLSLDDTVAELLPGYPEVGARITVHQLLSHTAGLPNYLTSAALAGRMNQKLTPQQLLELFWNEPLEFAPGSDFRYSDSGYAVLGAIIEKVSGRAYAEHMQRDLFDRFGLTHTTVGDTEDGARGYVAGESGALEPALTIDASILYAAAGIRSSANDLLRWHDALAAGAALAPAQLELFSKPVRENYAYGWFVREDHGFTVTSHAGATPGFSAEFLRVPELDLAIVVLTNDSAVEASPIADSALSAALGEKVQPLEKATPIDLDTAVTSRLTGTFRLSDAAAERLKARKISKQALQAMRSVRIYEEKGKLYFKPVGQTAVPMLATGAGSFTLLGGKAKIQAVLDADGSPATRLTLTQGTLEVEYTRRARVHGKAFEEDDAEELEPER
jgi:CubicO group peptidase (beta-lactamase class C family)